GRYERAAHGTLNSLISILPQLGCHILPCVGSAAAGPQRRCLKNCMARSCCTASSRVANVPRFLRLRQRRFPGNRFSHSSHGSPLSVVLEKVKRYPRLAAVLAFDRAGPRQQLLARQTVTDETANELRRRQAPLVSQTLQGGRLAARQEQRHF